MKILRGFLLLLLLTMLGACSSRLTTIKEPVVVSPPPSYLILNKRPHCDYDNVNNILECLEEYKALADVNDEDKLKIREWVNQNKDK